MRAEFSEFPLTCFLFNRLMDLREYLTGLSKTKPECMVRDRETRRLKEAEDQAMDQPYQSHAVTKGTGSKNDNNRKTTNSLAATFLLRIQDLQILQIHISTNPQIHKSTNPQIHKSTNPQIHKSTNSQIHKSTNPTNNDRIVISSLLFNGKCV
jgi:hypothetical protein